MKKASAAAMKWHGGESRRNQRGWLEIAAARITRWRWRRGGLAALVIGENMAYQRRGGRAAQAAP